MIDLFSSPFKKKGVRVSPKISPLSVSEIQNEEQPIESLQYLCSSFIHSRENILSIDTDLDLFSSQLSYLVNSESTFDAIVHLKKISDILKNINYLDKLTICKFRFQNAIESMRFNDLYVFLDLEDRFKEVVISHFTISNFDRLPTILVQEIFLWLNHESFFNYFSVCKYWKEILYEDTVWKELYNRKFTLNNVNSLSSTPSQHFRLAFKKRLHDPFIGDKVEVAWRGKFRLESSEVYEGLAWWVAEVVDTHSSQGKYKIRYPGWESRWDEWVTRNRFRWLVEENKVQKIQASDYVELWCCGSNVPGAWLESRVLCVKNSQYCLAKVSTGGPMWVNRDRIRLSNKKKSYNQTNFSESEETDPSSVSIGSTNSISRGQTCLLM